MAMTHHWLLPPTQVEFLVLGSGPSTTLAVGANKEMGVLVLSLSLPLSLHLT